MFVPFVCSTKFKIHFKRISLEHWEISIEDIGEICKTIIDTWQSRSILQNSSSYSEARITIFFIFQSLFGLMF